MLNTFTHFLVKMEFTNAPVLRAWQETATQASF